MKSIGQLTSAGLVLREAMTDLEQEIQRLANLLADQPDVSSPRQTDIQGTAQDQSGPERRDNPHQNRLKPRIPSPLMRSGSTPAAPKTSDAPATKKN